MADPTPTSALAGAAQAAAQLADVGWDDLPAEDLPAAAATLARARAVLDAALVSVAGIVAVEGGRISSARLAFGGLGPMPWRNEAVEAALVGQEPTDAAFDAAADALVADARGHGSNDFKIPLTRRTLIATLRELTQEG